MNDTIKAIRTAYLESNAYKRKNGLLPTLPEITTIADEITTPTPQKPSTNPPDDVEFL